MPCVCVLVVGFGVCWWALLVAGFCCWWVDNNMRTCVHAHPKQAPPPPHKNADTHHENEGEAVGEVEEPLHPRRQPVEQAAAQAAQPAGLDHGADQRAQPFHLVLGWFCLGGGGVGLKGLL